MKNWKVFLPEVNDLHKLLLLEPGKAFFRAKNSPIEGALYVRNRENQWLSLSWDYVDVEFKFEIFYLSIESQQDVTTDDLIFAANIPSFGSLELLVKSEWVRPTLSGEVPDDFEELIEECGTIKSVPASATAIGTAISGVMLSDQLGVPLWAIIIDDVKSYSTRIVSSLDALVSLKTTCDVFSCAALLDWRPPI